MVFLFFKKSIIDRSKVIAMVFFALLFMLVLRLYYIQVHPAKLVQGELKNYQTEVFNGSRYSVIDTNGESLVNDIEKYVEEKLGYCIAKDSLDYARFCTHVKFAIQRILTNNTVENDLTRLIKSTYPESYSISEGIAEIIGDNIGVSVTEEEIACLTIHIERFRINRKK